MVDKDQNPSSKPKPRKSHLVSGVVAAMLVLVVLLAGLCALQVKDIERGTVEVAATQQDGYVELVVEQIALQGDRADKEIIKDILSTLDANGGSYWAFSKGQTMLYVKDSTQTTRYRNLTADSYFSTKTAEEFAASLGLEHATHSVIEIDGRQYVASGELFSYRGSDYRLCLLTNKDVLLESNAMLGARSRLTVLLGVVLALLLIIPTALAMSAARTRNKQARLEADFTRMARTFAQLNQRLSTLDEYDVKSRLWQERMLPKFEERAREKGVPVAKVLVECDDLAARDAFLSRAAVVLGRQVVRFSESDTRVVLLMIDGTAQQLEDAVHMIEGQGARLSQVTAQGEEE